MCASGAGEQAMTEAKPTAYDAWYAAVRAGVDPADAAHELGLDKDPRTWLYWDTLTKTWRQLDEMTE